MSQNSKQVRSPLKLTLRPLQVRQPVFVLCKSEPDVFGGLSELSELMMTTNRRNEEPNGEMRWRYWGQGLLLDLL